MKKSEEDETPEIYGRMLDSYFLCVEEGLDSLFLQCIEYKYPAEVKYVDFAIYPESFTGGFEVYVWPTMCNGSLASTTLQSLFKEGIDARLSDDLDPGDIDYEWRAEVFSDRINQMFSRSWIRVNGSRFPMRYYVLRPDAPTSWCVNLSEMVRQENK
jgi:hypothetical protein